MMRVALTGVVFMSAVASSVLGQPLQTQSATPDRPRIAVADFKVLGDVGIKDAGKVVAELLVTKFSPDRYQMVERGQLVTILNEVDLTISQVADNPALLEGRKVQGVRYLVLGSVSKLGYLEISARLVDIVDNPGDMVQTAQAKAEDARGLQDAMSELARILQMTEDEKKAYLDDGLYPQILAEARDKASVRQYNKAISLYQRAISIRSTREVHEELKNVQASYADVLRKMEAERDRERTFAGLMERARQIASTMPSQNEKPTDEQKAAFAEGTVMLQQALELKPEDELAQALREKVEFAFMDSDPSWWLHRALEASEKMDNEPLRDHVYGAIAKVEIRMGDLSGANRVLQGMENPSLICMYSALLLQYQVQVGDRAGAGDTMARIRAALRNPNRVGNQGSLSSYAQCLALLEDTTEAKTTAEEIENPFSKACAYASISCIQAQCGDCLGAEATLELAKTAIERIDHAALRDAAKVCLIKQTLLPAGDIAGSMALLTKIDDVGQKVKAICSIAYVLLDRGDKEGAASLLDAAKNLAGEKPTDSMCVSIACVLARSGDSVGAKAFSEKLESLHLKVIVYNSIANAQLKNQDALGAAATIKLGMEVARAALAAHDDNPLKVFLWESCAETAVRAGMSTEARCWYEEQPDATAKAYIAVGAAKGVAEMQDLWRRD